MMEALQMQMEMQKKLHEQLEVSYRQFPRFIEKGLEFRFKVYQRFSFNRWKIFLF